jgi:capsule polysaccharide export protein KpsE/RkpR
MVSGSGGTNAIGSLVGGALNIKNPSDVYVAMLKSRTIQDKLIDRFDLKKLYRKRTYVDARKKLENNTDISTGKEGVITIDINDESPERARDMAKAYVDELFKLSENIATTEAGQRRMFYERELERQKDRLADAEVALKDVQLQTGLIAPSDQAKVIIENASRVRAMISAKQVQIGALRQFATPNNPLVQQAETELAELQKQLAKLEKDQQSREGDFMVPTRRVPESAMQFIRAYREFKYQETVFELLAKQFEVAKLDESKDFAMLQVLDWPVRPDKRATPYRSLIVALFGVTAFLASITYVFIEHSHHLKKESPEYARKAEMVKRYWMR